MSAENLARCSDENELNHEQSNTKLFLPIARRAKSQRKHANNAKRLKAYNVIVLVLSQLYCLKIGRGFRF